MDASDWQNLEGCGRKRAEPLPACSEWARIESKSPSTEQDLRAEFTIGSRPVRPLTLTYVLVAVSVALAWSCQGRRTDAPSAATVATPFAANQITAIQAPR